MDCTTNLANAKALISHMVTAQLICIFVFAYVKIGFSHVTAYVLVYLCVVKLFSFCQYEQGVLCRPILSSFLFEI